MPADDIGHPIPDLTGYITEGQKGGSSRADVSQVIELASLISRHARYRGEAVAVVFEERRRPRRRLLVMGCYRHSRAREIVKAHAAKR